MSEILHLNLHREFFAAIASKKKRVERREQLRKTRRKCWWNFVGCVVMEKVATPTMPSALDAY